MSELQETVRNVSSLFHDISKLVGPSRLAELLKQKSQGLRDAYEIDDKGQKAETERKPNE